MAVIKFNPHHNPKPITEGEVWQGDPLFPNELRDDNEKLLIIEEAPTESERQQEANAPKRCICKRSNWDSLECPIHGLDVKKR